MYHLRVHSIPNGLAFKSCHPVQLPGTWDLEGMVRIRLILASTLVNKLTSRYLTHKPILVRDKLMLMEKGRRS